MLSFDDTEIAFRSKTNLELQRAYLLFKMIDSNILVKIGDFAAQAALKIRLPISWVVKPTIYRHFVGGETIEDCKQTAEHLGKFNVRAILDYSIEGSDDPADIQAAMTETLHSIENAGKDSNVAFSVFKPTAFTRNIVLEKASNNEKLTPEEQAELEKFNQRIDQLCAAAFKSGKPVLIDAEDYCYQAQIDATVRQMMQKYNKQTAVVFNTFQMYRHDRLAFLKSEVEHAKANGYVYGAKFVRGAYMEKERARAQEKGYPSPIQPDKASTDRDFDAALTYTIENIQHVHIFNGTHNDNSCLHLTKEMEKHGIARNDKRVWFSQLYGMSDHISFNLANAGYNVAKYVPYGPVRHVLPYLLRRVEENTSVSGQTGRELALILKEKQRRKNVKK